MWSSLPLVASLLTPAADPLVLENTPSMAASEPYGAWAGSRHTLPPPVLDPGPAPLPAEPELSRRAFELVPELGAALPQCGESGRSGCAALGPATELGVSALYRTSPTFAFGASARMDAFNLGGSASGQSLFAGVAGRVYFFESGLWDPYVELALGVASLAVDHAEGRLRLHDEIDFAPAARVAIGLDFLLNPWLKAGPVLALSRHSPRSAERCRGASCAAIDVADAALPEGMTSFGLRLTFSAGEAR